MLTLLWGFWLVCAGLLAALAFLLNDTAEVIGALAGLALLNVAAVMVGGKLRR